MFSKGLSIKVRKKFSRVISKHGGPTDREGANLACVPRRAQGTSAQLSVEHSPLHFFPLFCFPEHHSQKDNSSTFFQKFSRVSSYLSAFKIEKGLGLFPVYSYTPLCKNNTCLALSPYAFKKEF